MNALASLCICAGSSKMGKILKSHVLSNNLNLKAPRKNASEK